VAATEPQPDARKGHGLGRGGKLAVVAFLAAIVAFAAYVRIAGVNGPTLEATTARCQQALTRAAALGPTVTGAAGLFRPARTSQDLRALAFTDDNGRTVTLGAFAGKTILVNFWATWCVPCRAEMPALDRLQAERGGNGFAVVAVNLDTNSTRERERAFLGDVGATHLALHSDPTLSLTAELKRRGLVFGLPTTILIDDAGCRLGTVEGGMAWDSPDAATLLSAATGRTST
jgi:thiol-disulfide isomerase/thioredoxin